MLNHAAAASAEVIPHRLITVAHRHQGTSPALMI